MKKFLIAAPLALAAGALLSTPASAANWNSAGQLRVEINQLDRQIDRARGLSPREEQRLEQKVNQLNSLYRSYARGGFSRAEVRSLGSRIDLVKAQLAQQTRDFNGHYGPNDHRGPNGHQDGRGHR